MSSRLASNSEADASELPENIPRMFLVTDIDREHMIE